MKYSFSEVREYLLGIAGGVCLASAFSSVPAWLLTIAICVVVWDFCNLLFKVYDEIKERNQ